MTGLPPSLITTRKDDYKITSKGKKKKKYRLCVPDDYDYYSSDNCYSCTTISAAGSVSPQGLSEDMVPESMRLRTKDSGICLGKLLSSGWDSYVGISQGSEGNFMVVGGNGSGKSSGIAKPTLKTWQGALCVTDIKGELSDSYEELYRKGFVTRPYTIFDPTQPDGPSYDPFGWLSQDDSHNLVNNVQELALAIIPLRPDEKDPFWTETERGVLAAALLYYFKLGLSFSETMCVISSQPLSSLCKKLTKSDSIQVQMFLGEMADMKDETLAAVDRGLRNKIMLFATDPYISHVFRGSREGAECFTWENLDTHNIFLRIPSHRIEQWGGAINLIYTQLIRYLERRPEMYSPEGANNVQTLLLMDEFARFGKLEMITAAMSTLRSKNVNICLMIQSLAQLDKIYGEYDRRIILDNCQYQAILRANDAETQKYLAELAGTHMSLQRSRSEHEDEFGDTTGYSRQISETRDWVIQPHELATLNNLILLTPYGSYRVEKFRPGDEDTQYMLSTASNTIRIPAIAYPVSEDTKSQSVIHCEARPVETATNITKNNEGARIMSLEERLANANKRIENEEQKRRLAERNTQGEQRKKDQRRNYVIGELVTRYFPEIRAIEPGSDAENSTRFEHLEAFLYVLSTDYELVKELQERAAQLVTEYPDGAWRISV